MFRNEKGFTLIELVIVIVILGLLAAVAMPKYQDLKSDAQEAAANGVYGAAQGAAAINFATNIVKGTSVYIGDAADLVDAMDGLPDGWALTAGSTSLYLGSYQIAVSAAEDASTKAVLKKSGF